MKTDFVHYQPEDPGLVWIKDEDIAISPDTPLDCLGVLTPNVIPLPEGGYRMYYMGRGFNTDSLGYILSAYSHDGTVWRKEDGIRVLNHSPHAERRTLCPDVIPLPEGGYRMYFEAWPRDDPGLILSARSADGITWFHELGIRVRTPGVQYGAPRCLPLPDGRWRLYFHHYPQPMKEGMEAQNHIISAVSKNGLDFELEEGVRVAQTNAQWENYAVYAPEILQLPDGSYRMYYAGWTTGRSRGRIFSAKSKDGLNWIKDEGICVDCGGAHDFQFASEPCVIRLPDGRYRMYYEACDEQGICRILSATTPT